jgi:hypothetical protein
MGIGVESTIFSRPLIRQCPRCTSREVHTSPRKTFFETAVLRLLYVRPFRCESCRNRFYALACRRRAPSPEQLESKIDGPVALSVFVYGRQKDKEPFREQTEMLLVNVHGALLSLTAGVEPGQKLVVFSPETEEDQKCRVAFVSEAQAGKSMIGIRFSRPAWEFWSLAVPHAG